MTEWKGKLTLGLSFQRPAHAAQTLGRDRWPVGSLVIHVMT
jgi:hypothetical protein